MKIEEAITVLSVKSHWSDEAWNQGAIQTARDIAIEALREKQQQDCPKPLTLEELKERAGKPVWVVDGMGNRKWCLVDARPPHTNKPDAVSVGEKPHDADFYNLRNDKRLHPIGWLAYDSEPKEESK